MVISLVVVVDRVVVVGFAVVVVGLAVVVVVVVVRGSAVLGISVVSSPIVE